MSLPSQPEKDVQNIVAGESFYERPKTVLLSEKQWLYVQKRYHMSQRELQVAKLVCQGFTNGDIARRLQVKPGTVKTHLRSIFNKTRVRNKITMLLRFMEIVRKLFDESNRTALILAQDEEKRAHKAIALAEKLIKKEEKQIV